MGLSFDELFPGRFLKAGLFKGRDVTLTLKKVRLEELPKEGGGAETKAILAFQETGRELVLNKTNGLCIRAMFGSQTDDWVGKRVTFYPAQIQFEDNDLAIRVRGSPDLAEDVTFDLKLPRKKARRTSLKKTPAKGGKGAVDEPADAPPADAA